MAHATRTRAAPGAKPVARAISPTVISVASSRRSMRSMRRCSTKTEGARPVAAEKLRTVPNPAPREDEPAAAAPVGSAVNLVRSSGAAGEPSQAASQITFDVGSATLGGAAMSIVDQIAAQARKQAVEFVLTARDTENWDARKRDALTDQRIAAVTSALVNQGIAPGAISLSWRPDPSDTSIHRDGPGLQEIARLRIQGAAAPAAPAAAK